MLPSTHSIVSISPRQSVSSALCGLSTFKVSHRTRASQVRAIAQESKGGLIANSEHVPGQDLYFHLNHPIKWVRIVGVVVAIDEFAQRRIYTVDDSNGACIECVVTVPKSILKPTLSGEPNATKNQQELQKQIEAREPALVPTIALPYGLDVGSVVDVKGGLAVFRGNKQIKMERITILRSTEQEVTLWNKISLFREDILSQPWTLSAKELRKCRKQAEGTADETAEQKKAKKRKLARAAKTSTGLEKGNTITTEEPKMPSSKVTGLEKGASATATEKSTPKSSRTTGLEKGNTIAMTEPPKPTISKVTGSEPTAKAATADPRAVTSKTTGLEKRSIIAAVAAEKPRVTKPKATGPEPDSTTTEKPRSRPTGLERRSTTTSAKLRDSSPTVTGLEKRSTTAKTGEPAPRPTGLERRSSSTVSVKQSVDAPQASRATDTEKRNNTRKTDQPQPVPSGLTDLEGKNMAAENPRARPTLERNSSSTSSTNSPATKASKVTGLERGISTRTTEKPKAMMLSIAEETEAKNMASENRTPRVTGLERGSTTKTTTDKPKTTSSRVTGLEKRSKTPVEVPANIKGKYSALGL